LFRYTGGFEVKNKKKDTVSTDQGKMFLSEKGKDDGTDDLSDNDTSQYSVNDDATPLDE
jgi:hypothetical protein